MIGNLFGKLAGGLAAKFLPSILRGLVAIAIAALSAFAGLDPVSILNGAHVGISASLILPIWGIFLTLIHSLVASLQHAVAVQTSPANANISPAAPVK